MAVNLSDLLLQRRPLLQKRVTMNLTRRQCSAWLGIFSLLLLFLAPETSRLLSQQHACTPEITASGYHSAAPAGLFNDTDLPDRVEPVCHYCLLLIHFPLLNLFSPPRPVSMCFRFYLRAGKPEARPYSRRLRTNALARAPPATDGSEDLFLHRFIPGLN